MLYKTNHSVNPAKRLQDFYYLTAVNTMKTGVAFSISGINPGVTPKPEPFLVEPDKVESDPKALPKGSTRMNILPEEEAKSSVATPEALAV